MPEKPKKLFISHSQKDKKYVSAIVDLLVDIGLRSDEVFCSSVPGFGIPYGDDIYEVLKKQFVDYDLCVLFILSDNYYESAACLNEMGATWILQKKYDCILLPGFEFVEVDGAVNPRKKMMKLEGDLAELKNSLRQLMDGLVQEFGLREMTSDFWERCRDQFLSKISSISQSDNHSEQGTLPQPVLNEGFQLSTDDEKIIMYYLITKQVCNVDETVIEEWLIENEIYDVNIKNGFMLLSSIGEGKYTNNSLALDLKIFREMMRQKDSLIVECECVVNSHQYISAVAFKKLWSSMSDCDKLLAAYISDEKVSKLGVRWKATDQIEQIKKWERSNCAGSLLSGSYEDAVQFFVDKRFVYESDWTAYDNPKEYTLCKSLKNFLWSGMDSYTKEIEAIKVHSFLS